MLFLGLAPSFCFAQTNLNPSSVQPMVSDQDTDEDLPEKGGFAKPYEYEREAFGYDPDGVEYKENQPEDFQVIFITALPFTTLGSFALTGVTSQIVQGKFSVGGDYFIPFLSAAGVGAVIIACVSVLTNKYPPPDSFPVVENLAPPPVLAFRIPLVTAKF